MMVWPRPGPRQPVQVLVVMEGVAAGPVHQPDVRIDAAAAVEFIGLAGMQQHVGHARHGNRDACRVAARAHFRRGQVGPGIAGSVHRAVPEGEAAAGQADLAQQRGQRHAPQYGCSPRWLRCSDQAQVSSVRQPAASRASRRMVAAGTPQTPSAHSGAGPGAGAAQHIVGVGLEAVAAARHEIRVVQALGQQRVRHAQHQGRVGIGSDGHPFGIQRLGRIAARRLTIIVRMPAARARASQPGVDGRRRRRT